MEHTRFVLDKFSGPLELLVLLVHKKELEATDIWLKNLFAQFHSFFPNFSCSLDDAADFIGDFSQLIYFKSLLLSPQEKGLIQEELSLYEEAKTRFIESLLEYTAFKKGAKELGQREENQLQCYMRGKQEELQQKGEEKPLEEISLDTFSKLFLEVYLKSEQRKSTIWEERWRVSDKIHYLRERIQESSLRFKELFSLHLAREELIVTFLAVLELIKHQELAMIQEEESITFIKAEKNAC